MRIKHIIYLACVVLLLSSISAQNVKMTVADGVQVSVAGWGAELVANGEFESDASFWVAGNSATLTGGTANPYSGVGCLTVTENGAADPDARKNAPNLVSVSTGKRYYFKCRVKAGTEATYRVFIYDADNLAIIDDTGDLEASADWNNEVELEFIAPVGCSNVRTYLRQIAANGAGTTMYFDQVSIREVPARTTIK